MNSNMIKVAPTKLLSSMEEKDFNFIQVFNKFIFIKLLCTV